MITAEPRPYQVEPLAEFFRRMSILLALDTGLGKTYMAIKAAEELLETAQVDHVLMVVPAGLKFQWAEAIAKFTDLPTQAKVFKGERLVIPDSRYCMVIDGPPAKRKRQYRMVRETPSCNYVIIGYDNVDSDARDVKRIRAEFVVLDEATAIKTMSSQRTLNIKEHLSEVPWRMALTATPIDNRPDELFSIMEWVDADVLGRGDLFDLAYIERNVYGDPTGYRNLNLLRKRLGKAMYRKSVDDPDVAPFMPDRKMLDWRVQFDGSTREVYAKMAWDLLEALEEVIRVGGKFNPAAHYAGHRKADESTAVGKAMAIHTCMEMLLDHPDAVFASGLEYLENMDLDDEAGSEYAARCCGDPDFLELTHSPKLSALMYRLFDDNTGVMADPASKVIIFTRYRRVQEIIEGACQDAGYDVAVYHGGLTTAEQQAARARFLKRPDCRIFISTHAGERGTDLPVANWLVNYDAVWSAGQADQINGRHMRTSSEFNDIFVANMFFDGSVEERKLDQQDDKRKLARAVVDGHMPKDGRVGKAADTLKAHVMSWLHDNDPAGMLSRMTQ